ncbi:MAG: MOSC domain-containing protein [Gammaproteobacteria bacterium]|nr:MOSC domain-containing protein [Gammaproteobacteria bacterium]
MRIQSLNVATPGLIEYKGESVITGINKLPTNDALVVRRHNIDGDAQADLSVHGGVDKAVYAFPSEHYSFFQAELQQDAYPRGQFGENLTTVGLLEANVRIGDRYRVGEVLFEVSQPRSPCYKFAIKMGTAEALAVMINSARTGIYLRVLSEGMIQAGDPLELEYSDSSAPSVDEIHRLYYLDRKNFDGLARALRCERLSREFKDDFALRLEALSVPSATPAQTGDDHDD